MDIEHHNQKLQLDGKLHICPLDNPQEVLDLGTGTGIWAIDMADEYPSCQVIGTDLSPVQPTWVPPNCRFDVDDFEQEWYVGCTRALLDFFKIGLTKHYRTFGDNRFDLIHGRFLMGSISDHNKLYKRIFNALKPGGYFEVSEMEGGTYSDDGTVGPDFPSVKWWAWLEEAFIKIGKPIIKIDEYPKLMTEAGFEDIQFMMLKRPTNDWPKDQRMKEIGRYTCLNYLEGLEGFTMAPFTRVLGWSPDEVQVLVAQVRAESVKRKIHGWQKG